MGLLCSPALLGRALKKTGDLTGLSGVQRYSKTPSPFHIHKGLAPDGDGPALSTFPRKAPGHSHPRSSQLPGSCGQSSCFLEVTDLWPLSRLTTPSKDREKERDLEDSELFLGCFLPLQPSPSGFGQPGLGGWGLGGGSELTQLVCVGVGPARTLWSGAPPISVLCFYILIISYTAF